MKARIIGAGLLALGTACSVAVAPVAASASTIGVNNSASVAAAPSAAKSTAPDTTSAFPSGSSTVVGSVGFIDADQAGYFWSVARGDSVAQTLSGPSRIKKAVLKLDVVSNVLVAGAFVNWAVSINGTDVGAFSITSGQLGAVTKKFTFSKITGGSYLVKMRVTNEVASGEGSHTFRYAGAGPHSINLKRR